jgi:N-methylhydantoinase A/oxoprolinase/acetone carboxylase beta subunit
MNAFTTAEMVEQITWALLGPAASAKERYAMTNTLGLLVQLAKSEFRMDMARSIQKATAHVTVSAARRTAKAAIRKASASGKQFELDWSADLRMRASAS